MAKKRLTTLLKQLTPDTLAELHRVFVLSKKETEVSVKKETPVFNQLSLFNI